MVGCPVLWQIVVLEIKIRIKKNRPWDQKNLGLNSTDKVKSGFLLPLMCIFHESNGKAQLSPRKSSFFAEQNRAKGGPYEN